MSFPTGSVTFRRFKVVGNHPSEISPEILDKLKAHIIEPQEFGVPEEIEYGWSGGAHIRDDDFTFEKNVFSDCLHIALRLDTNRVPAEVKKSYQHTHDSALAAGNPSGFISKAQKRQSKDLVKASIEEELKSRKYQRSKLIPILWDFTTHTLYTPASATAGEKLQELFERTFNLSLDTISTGTLALDYSMKSGLCREYEDTKPTRFTPGPDGESQQPEYGWVSKGPQPKDFLGNEFLLWLWHESEHGLVNCLTRNIDVVANKSIDMDCAYGQTGKDVIKADEPTKTPEARDALRSGKVPRKMNLLIGDRGYVYELSLSAESLAVSGAKLPDSDEADGARSLFEDRIVSIRNLTNAIDTLFESFLRRRFCGSWDRHTEDLRRWIQQK